MENQHENQRMEPLSVSNGANGRAERRQRDPKCRSLMNQAEGRAGARWQAVFRRKTLKHYGEDGTAAGAGD